VAKQHTFNVTVRAIIVLLAIVLTGCETNGRRDESVNKDVSSEVKRICALPKEQRDAELKRVNEESGITLYCGG